MLEDNDIVKCLVARCDSVPVLQFLVITLSLVLLMSAYYSGKCDDGQQSIRAVRIGIVVWNGEIAFYRCRKLR